MGIRKSLGRIFQRPPKRLDLGLDRPIFLVGCCKSGTTLLSSLLLQHPDLGPKHRLVRGEGSSQDKVQQLLEDHHFNTLAHEVEQKEIWDRFFPMQNVKLRMGLELRLLENPLTADQQRELVKRLTTELREPRFFSKHPANLYRLHALKAMFPDARFIAIHRDGRDVIASWGRKGNRWKQFGGFASAIETFGKKWSDAVEHLEEYRAAFQIEVCRYEDLVQAPTHELQRLLSACDLPACESITENLELRSTPSLWRSRIPTEYHDLTEQVTARMRTRLGYES